MSLSDLAAFGSFVSGIAVLASLLFLFHQSRKMAEQLRQAEKNQQAVIRQARSTRGVDITLRATEPTLCEAIGLGFLGRDDISEIRLRQFGLYTRAMLYEWEDAFFQHQDGLLSDAAFGAFSLNIEQVVKNVGVRALWRLQRGSFSPEFVAWMDKLIGEAPAPGPVDATAVWKTALAAERAGAPY